jgi:hypothetical protein
MADLDPNEYTVEELSDELDEIDDPETLQEIREAEADGQDRTGAKAELDERIEAVTEDGEESESDATAQRLESAVEEMDDEDENEANASENRSDDGMSLIDVRNQVRDNAGDLIGRALDGIVEIEKNEGEWRALVEIIERNSVPDTQDILGRYALQLDGNGEITGYRRLDRYRRGDTRREEAGASEPPY